MRWAIEGLFGLGRARRGMTSSEAYNRGYMVRELDAVFEAGVLRPLEPLLLSERQLVRVTVDDRRSSEDPQGAPRRNLVDDRRIDRTEEMLWLATEAKPYAGHSVALIGPAYLRTVRMLARFATQRVRQVWSVPC